MDRLSFLRKIGIATTVGVVAPSLMFAEETPVQKNKKNVATLPSLYADVIVVGAGPSGIPAAIAAAREGAKVILLEEDSLPGGAPVDMYVDMLCGGPRVGIFREMIQRLNQDFHPSGKPNPEFGEDAHKVPGQVFLPSSYAIVTSDMMAREKNLTLMCGAHVSELIVEAKGNRNIVKGVSIYRGLQKQHVIAPVTIDATGTGLIGELAGAPVMYGKDGRSTFNESIGSETSNNQVQQCTWQFFSQALKPGATLPWDKLKWKGMVEFDHGWVRGNPETLDRATGLYLNWGGKFTCKDTRDPVALAETQYEALKSLTADFEEYQKAGFMVHLAPKLGVREVRRIKGEYVINTEDIIQGKYADDTIAHCHYGLDSWGESFKKDNIKAKPYGIPYRSLLPLNVEGLILAGKSISGSHIAASSYRVQSVVASIGQAAGTAAAMASINKTSPRNIDVKKLIGKLNQAGLFINKK